jgi:TatD DNase family protein
MNNVINGRDLSSGVYLVDSHCHLTFSRFDTFVSSMQKGLEGEKADVTQHYGVEQLLARADQAGVKYVLAIGTELADLDVMQGVAENHSNVFRTIGVHALEAKKHSELYDSEYIIQSLKNHCSKPKTVGIGEIGLDYHYEKESAKQQMELFHLQLELAKDQHLPVVIHSREAYLDTVNILREHSPIDGVIHCFSGERDFAIKALDLGFYISVSGVLTYKNAAMLRDTVKTIPLDRLLVETDAPFLAPEPFRGKINEPAYVVHVARKLADILGLSFEKVADQTSKNFWNLFKRTTIIPGS